MGDAGISTISCRGTMRWCGHSFKTKAIIVGLVLLKVSFNKPSLYWSSVCETLKSRSLKSSAKFRFVTPWRTLSIKTILRSFTVFTGTRGMIAQYYRHTNSTYISSVQQSDGAICFSFGPLLACVFRIEPVISQLHKQVISPISLVQFNRYCERGSDNDQAFMGEGLNKTLFSQCLQTFFFFSRTPR